MPPSSPTPTHGPSPKRKPGNHLALGVGIGVGVAVAAVVAAGVAVWYRQRGGRGSEDGGSPADVYAKVEDDVGKGHGATPAHGSKHHAYSANNSFA